MLGDVFVVVSRPQVGEESSAVLADPAAVVDAVLLTVRHAGGLVGVGAGPLGRAEPDGALESGEIPSGPVLALAGLAVEAAAGRARAVPLAVRGFDDGAGRDAEAVLVLLAATLARRSVPGWEVVDAMAEPATRQDDVAARLGISQQAVSQRLRAALWAEEQAARRAAARLLTLAEGAGLEVPRGHGHDAR